MPSSVVWGEIEFELILSWGCLNNRTNEYSNICHLDLYHKPVSFLKALKYWQDLGYIFLLLLWVARWVVGLSETGSKANLSLSLSWDWAEAEFDKIKHKGLKYVCLCKSYLHKQFPLLKTFSEVQPPNT